MPRMLSFAVAALAFSAGPALAHARLLRALPRVGSTVQATPRELRLSFSESIDVRRSSITLAGPAGPAPIGPPVSDAQDGRVLHAPITGPLLPGSYRVRWAVTSMDTHRTDGDFVFRVAPAGR